MDKQPESLLLAEYIEQGGDYAPTLGSAAAELRRQHALIAELVEALTVAVTQNDYEMLMTGEELRMCAAVLDKAKEQ